MAEWQEQLNTILSDPEAMAQIVSLAQSISGGGDPSPPPDAPPRDPPREPTREPAETGGADASAFGGLDPELLRRLTPLIREMNRGASGEAAALLMALRPFLSEKRRGKVERAAQLARLIHLGKTFLTSQEQEGAGRV